jgi:hypothetical protein
MFYETIFFFFFCNRTYHCEQEAIVTLTLFVVKLPNMVRLTSTKKKVYLISLLILLFKEKADTQGASSVDP